MEIKILGCGPSVGVPVIGCDCEVCNSNSSFNKRSRSSVLIGHEDKNILVDFGADIRQLLLREKIKSINAAILTHDHADHVNGIDDLKIFSFYSKKPLDLYSDKKTLEDISKRFIYMFESPDKNDHWAQNRLKPIEILFDALVNIENINIQFFLQHHGRIDSLGFKINNFAYSNDVISFPPESEKFLYDLDTWVVDCLEMESSPSHAGLDKVLYWQEKYRPKQIFLTNMNHSIDYEKIVKLLPSNISPAYDGLVIRI